MGEATFVTQSKYFSPALNAAIFDGPIRIYFAQYQEAQALKVYFQFSHRLAELRTSPTSIFRDRSRSIFVILYPSSEIFDESFGPQINSDGGGTIATESSAQFFASVRDPRFIGREKWESDFVLGVRGPFEDDADMALLYTQMEDIVCAGLAGITSGTQVLNMVSQMSPIEAPARMSAGRTRINDDESPASL